MSNVTVYIAKLDPNHTLKVNGVEIHIINASDPSDPNNGFVEVKDISPKLPTVLHNGETLDYVEGEFVDNVFFTAIHEGDYLTFRNGAKAISYKPQYLA